MSHGHSHHVEEHPGTKGISGIYLGLIVAGFIIFLVAFVKSMSAGHGDSHGKDHHVSVSHSDDHSWAHTKKSNEISTNEILGNQENLEVVTTPAPVAVTTDSAQTTPVVKDSTATAQ